MARLLPSPSVRDRISAFAGGLISGAGLSLLLAFLGLQLLFVLQILFPRPLTWRLELGPLPILVLRASKGAVALEAGDGLLLLVLAVGLATGLLRAWRGPTRGRPLSVADDAPTPPEGYVPARPFRYPWGLLYGASALLLPLAFLGFGALARLLRRGVGTEVRVEGGEGAVSLLLVLLLIVGTVALHELVHGLALTRLGYRVRYGVLPTKMAAYAAAFGQFLRRDHLIRVALAPLILLSLLGSLAIPWVPDPLLPYLLLALSLNAAGAVGDLYAVWVLLGLPRETLFLDEDVERSWIYLPEGS